MSNKHTWQAEAEDHVRALAFVTYITGTTFTSNDVWKMGIDVPPNRRWLGPVMQRLAKEGVIRKVGSGVLSEHGHGSRMNSAWVGA